MVSKKMMSKKMPSPLDQRMQTHTNVDAQGKKMVSQKMVSQPPNANNQQQMSLVGIGHSKGHADASSRAGARTEAMPQRTAKLEKYNLKVFLAFWPLFVIGSSLCFDPASTYQDHELQDSCKLRRAGVD